MSAPVITVEPTGQEVSVGQAATFSVTATSDHGALTYQWVKGRQFGSSANISGATSSSYTTPVATGTDDGTVFYCVIHNADGTATTGEVILTVAPAYIIQKAVGINTTGGASVTVSFGQALKPNSVVVVAIAATDSGGAIGTDGDGSSYASVSDTLGLNYGLGSLVKIWGDRTNNKTFLTGFVYASNFNHDMPGGADSITFTFTPQSNTGNCQVGLVAYELAGVVNTKGDNCFSAAAGSVFPVANNLPGVLTWAGTPYGVVCFVIGAAFAGGAAITAGSGWTLDGAGTFGNSSIAMQSLFNATLTDVSPGQQTAFGSSPSSGLSSVGQGALFQLLAPFGTPGGGGNGGSATVFLGSVRVLGSAPAGCSNPFLGTVKVVGSAPAGASVPYLGSVVVGTPSGSQTNPSLGEVVEVVSASAGDSDPFLGTVATS